MLIEFAGNSGAGKTTTAARAIEILAEEGTGPRCAPARELTMPAVAAQLMINPRLLTPIRTLRSLSVSAGLSHTNWAPRVTTTALALRAARQNRILVIAPEIMFHWLKKLPLTAQPQLRTSGVPIPDLLVHIASTPAERLRRQILRGRPLNSIPRARVKDLESIASQTARDLLAAFPLDSATALMLRWGEGRADGRLAPARLLELLHDAAERSAGIDPARHLLSTEGRIKKSAEALQIPRIIVASQASTTLDEVASEAARAILDYVKNLSTLPG